MSTVMSSSTTIQPEPPHQEVSLLDQDKAALLDVILMKTFSTDQLMELAGLSVAQVIQHHYHLPTGAAPLRWALIHTSSTTPVIERIVVVCGSGNNGGDGLVAARHLNMFTAGALEIIVVYPKLNVVTNELYRRLLEQLAMCDVPVITTLPDDFYRSAERMRRRGGENLRENNRTEEDDVTLMQRTIVADAIFGYSAKGPAREPYRTILQTIRDAECRCVAVDIPSGWDVNEGPLDGGNDDDVQLGVPEVLVSLMLPKLGVRSLLRPTSATPPATDTATCAHYVGGRFVPARFAKEHALTLPYFDGFQQFTRLV